MEEKMTADSFQDFLEQHPKLEMDSWDDFQRRVKEKNES